MHKNKPLVKNVVGYSANFASSAVIGAAIDALVPLANLNPVGKVVHVIGRFFIGGAVGTAVQKSAEQFVDDWYEVIEEM